ncbi:MAG: TetR/AcrR family transcriptional regulator [Acidimicrobiales bacterium]
MTNSSTSQPAHRPSRRDAIIDAAIRLFARKGFVDASINDVAQEADVVVSAVYYHFSGKEELYSVAVQHVFSSISDVVESIRADDGPSDSETLARVIDAVWDWIDDHPDEATLFYLQLPGSTPQITTLRQDFEHLHTERAFGYVDQPTRARPPAARRALESLTARFLTDVLISIHSMRLAYGPLSGEPATKLKESLHEMTQRVVAIS